MVETQLKSHHPFQAPLAARFVRLDSTRTSQAWARTRFRILIYSLLYVMRAIVSEICLQAQQALLYALSALRERSLIKQVIFISKLN